MEIIFIIAAIIALVTLRNLAKRIFTKDKTPVQVGLLNVVAMVVVVFVPLVEGSKWETMQTAVMWVSISLVVLMIFALNVPFKYGDNNSNIEIEVGSIEQGEDECKRG